MAKKKSKRGKKCSRPKRPKKVWTWPIVISMLLLLVGSVVGAGIMAYEYDDYTFGNRLNCVVSAPDVMLVGSDVPILITTEDKDGSPKANEDVTIKMESQTGTKTLFEGKTNDLGFLSANIHVPDVVGNAKIIVDAGNEHIVEDLIIVNTSANPKARVLISTDKPIYQPGQDIHIRTIAFSGMDFSAVEVATTIQVTDPNGDRIFRETLESDEYGIASLDFPLSDQLTMGTYIIRASLSNEVHTDLPIVVKRYVLPKFNIELDDVNSWYLMDDTLHGEVNATYMFGEAVKGKAVVSVSAREDPAFADESWRWWEQPDYTHGEVLNGTLTNGKFHFSVNMPSFSRFNDRWSRDRSDMNYGAFYLDINVTVTDEAGHEEEEGYEITVASKPALPLIMADSFMKGRASNLYVLVMDPAGQPIPDEKVELRYNPSDYNTKTYTSYSNEKGLAVISFNFEGDGMAYLKIGASGNATYTYYIYGNSKIKLETDKRHYDPGDIAEFNVYFKPGKTGTVGETVTYHVMSEGLILSGGSTVLNDGKGTIKVPVDALMAPVSEVRVFKTLGDGTLALDALMFTVERPVDLDVTVDTHPRTYRPGEKVPIDIKVRAPNGDLGGPAALGVKIVDRSVYELSDRLVSNDEVFYGLRWSSQGPRYDVAMYAFSPSTQVPTMEGVVYEHGEDTGIGQMAVQSTYADFMVEVGQKKVQLIHGYWTALLFGGIVGLMVLLGKAVRSRRGGAMALMALFMGSIVILAAYAGGYDMLMPDEGNSSDPGSFNLKKQPSWRTMRTAEGGILGGGFDFSLPKMDTNEGGSSSPDTVSGVMSFSKGLNIREDFPETWYWNPVIITNENGNAHLDLNTPDTMTTWTVDAAASTKDGRFGLGQANITVFQDFFVEPDLPTYLVRNDSMNVPAMVYNYMDTDINATVTVKNDTWMDLNGTDTQNIVVPPDSVRSVNFTIRAKEVGQYTLTVGAKVGVLNDIVIRDVLVKPDGWKKTDLWNGQLEETDSRTMTIEQSPQRIPKSENAYIKVYGSIAGVALDGAENFIMFAYGCGEQSTSVLTVNLAAYRNLQIYNADKQDIDRVKRYVLQSVQYEQRYLINANGGRAVIWHPGEQADLWLTAWASFAYKDLEDANFGISESILDGMEVYMLSQQNLEGSWSFPDVGHWNINDELLDQRVASTAYIVTALLYSGHSVDANIERALDYIKDNIDLGDSAFTLAIALQALAMADSHSSLRTQIADKLAELAKDGPRPDQYYWDWMVPGKEDCKFCSRGNNVETTAYVVMALVKQGSHQDNVTGGLRYLLDTREKGVWDNTHSTAVALRAVNMEDSFRAKDMDVTIVADGRKVKSLHIDEDNNDMVFLTDLRSYLNETNITDVTIRCSGSGSMLFQMVYEEHLPWELYDGGKEELDLEVRRNGFHLDFSLRYLGIRPKLKMVLLEIPLPAGYRVDENELKRTVTKGVANDYEILEGKLVRYYIDNLEKDETRHLPLSINSNNFGTATMQGVIAFDMYDPDLYDTVLPITFMRMD